MGFIKRFLHFNKRNLSKYNHTTEAHDEDFRFESVDFDDDRIIDNADEGKINYEKLPQLDKKRNLKVKSGDIEFEPVNTDEKDYSENEWNLDGLFNTRITIEEAPISSKRHDRAVYISNGDTMKRTSNIMVGKKDINLPNGEYVGMNEVQIALRAYLNQKEKENAIFKLKEGKAIEYIQAEEIEKLVLEELKDKAKIKIGQGSEKVKNQDTATFFYNDEEKKEYLKKGILFLGKGKLTLPNDEYLSIEEIKKALEKYMLFEKNEEVAHDSKIVAFEENEEQDAKIIAFENVKQEIKSIKKDQFKIWPVISTAIKMFEREFSNITRGRQLIGEER